MRKNASFDIDIDVLKYLDDLLSPRDIGFLSRVYADGLEKYRRRIARIDFVNKEYVLDAGCGFGQWSLALAQTCRQVTGIDISYPRLTVCQRLAKANNIQNVSFFEAELENIPFNQAAFDAVFCYSVVYFTDYQQVFREFYRVLKPGGLLYICTNGPGRYLYDVIHKPNTTSDFNTRRYGIRTFWNMVAGRKKRLFFQDGARIMTRKGTKRNLQLAGFEVISTGGEGTLFFDAGKAKIDYLPFCGSKYMGLDSTFEVIAKKAEKKR